MKSKDIKNNLKNALEKSTPDCFEKISIGSYSAEYVFCEEKKEEEKDKDKKKGPLIIKRKYQYAFAMCFCIIIMILGTKAYYTPINDIYIDINPSVEIETNLFDRVISVDAKNDDGATIISSINIKNKNIDYAVDEILNELIEQGYISKEFTDNTILISVSAKSGEQAKQVSVNINKSVNKKLDENNISAVIMSQEITSVDKLKELSAQTGASVGKLQFVQKLLDGDNLSKRASIDINSLYNLKIKELLDFAKENNISLDELEDDIEDMIENSSDIDEIDEKDIDDIKEKNKNSNFKLEKKDDANYEGNENKNYKKDENEKDDEDDNDDRKDKDNEDNKEDNKSNVNNKNDNTAKDKDDSKNKSDDDEDDEDEKSDEASDDKDDKNSDSKNSKSNKEEKEKMQNKENQSGNKDSDDELFDDDSESDDSEDYKYEPNQKDGEDDDYSSDGEDD